MLHPAPGSGAALLHELGLMLSIGATLIFVFVLVLALRAVFSGARAVEARRWIIGGGIIFPSIVLTALLVYSLAIGNAVSSIGASGPLRFLLDCVSAGARALGVASAVPNTIRVEITAKQWWWEVRYRSGNPQLDQVVSANEIRLPAGRPIELFLMSDDVIHSFWAPSLAGKVDMIPGRRTRLTLKADKPGLYRGQCAEFCGAQHALMAFYVRIHTEADFQAWLTREAQPATAPEDPFLKLGHDAFMRARCGDCHTVRGTAAAGRAGPDLTHVGSRHSLAAGVLNNHIGTMAGWIAGSQDVKRGNFMPSMKVFDGPELRAVSAWLGSLQ